MKELDYTVVKTRREKYRIDHGPRLNCEVWHHQSWPSCLWHTCWTLMSRPGKVIEMPMSGIIIIIFEHPFRLIPIFEYFEHHPDFYYKTDIQFNLNIFCEILKYVIHRNIFRRHLINPPDCPHHNIFQINVIWFATGFASFSDPDCPCLWYFH